MAKLSYKAFACLFLLCVVQVNGYSKYGRSCRDIGCRSQEKCEIVNECDADGRKCGYPTCVPNKSYKASCDTMTCGGGQHCVTEDGAPKCVYDKPISVDLYPPVLDIFAENNGGEFRGVYRRQDDVESASGVKASGGSGYPSSSSGYPSYPSNVAAKTSGANVGSGYPSSSGSGYPSSSGSGYPKSSGYPSSSGSGYPSSSNSGYPGSSGSSGSGYPSSSNSGYPRTSGYPSSGSSYAGYPSAGSSGGYPSGGSGYPSSGGADDSLRRSSATAVNAGYPSSGGGYPSSGYPSNAGNPSSYQGQPARGGYPSQAGGYPASGGYQGQYNNNGAQYPGGYPQQGYQQPPRGGYDPRYPNGYPGGDYPQQKPKKPSITEQITNYAKNLAQRVLTQTIIDKVSGRS